MRARGFVCTLGTLVVAKLFSRRSARGTDRSIMHVPVLHPSKRVAGCCLAWPVPSLSFSRELMPGGLGWPPSSEVHRPEHLIVAPKGRPEVARGGDYRHDFPEGLRNDSGVPWLTPGFEDTTMPSLKTDPTSKPEARRPSIALEQKATRPRRSPASDDLPRHTAHPAAGSRVTAC